MPLLHRPTAAPGLFVTFEGGEGAGKSTQIERLRARLDRASVSVIATREPGGSKRAERIRSVLLSGRSKGLGPEAEAMLFAAARRDHIETLISPALNDGAVVLCDRFIDSSRVYQGEVGSVDPVLIQALEDAATSGILPDLTILLDVPAANGLARASARRGQGAGADRFEAEQDSFHAEIRRGFLALASNEPGRFRIIDGTRSEDEVEAAIWAVVAPKAGLVDPGTSHEPR